MKIVSKMKKDPPIAIHYTFYKHILDDYSIILVDKEIDENRSFILSETCITLINMLTPK